MLEKGCREFEMSEEIMKKLQTVRADAEGM
jgi:hypothetical protein